MFFSSDMGTRTSSALHPTVPTLSPSILSKSSMASLFSWNSRLRRVRFLGSLKTRLNASSSSFTKLHSSHIPYLVPSPVLLSQTSSKFFRSENLLSDVLNGLRFRRRFWLGTPPLSRLQSMGEVDSKPFESVQAALSLFGQKTEQRKYRSTRNEEVDKGIELDLMQKELSAYKVQLEIKESAHMQALLELEVCSKKVDELSTQLKESENEREKYIVEYKKTKSCLDKLESENTHLLAQLFENDHARGSLEQTLDELKTAEEELKAQLAALNEAKVSALTQVELMETACEMNKEKIEELLRHVSELNEAILFLKLAAIETEKEKTATLFSKDEAIEKAYEQIEEMKKDLHRVEDLENKLLTKNLLVETLELELKQAKGIASDAVKESENLKIEIEQMGQMNSEREIYVQSIEMQLHQSRQEVQRAQQVANDLNCQTVLFKDEIHKVKSEMAQVEEKESMAKLEIATLNSELQRARSKLSAAEAAELRAESIRSGLYLAVQELAMEAEAAKQDTQRLKQEATGTGNIISSEFGSTITISMEEYETLTREAKVTDDEPAPPIEDNMIESSYRLELEKLKLELGAAKEDIDNLVVAAEQAKARAEMAEKAKTAVEDQLRKYRERKEKKRAAIIALKEESSWWSSSPPVYDNQQATYQSLGKVLNMKF